MSDYGSQWELLMESLKGVDLMKLLQKRGIMVDHIAKGYEFERAGKTYQFDIIADSSKEVVIVQVEVILDDEHVEHFLNKAIEFIPQHSEYKGKKVYGAVAYSREEAKATAYAQSKGLLVIKTTEDSASIINPKDFKPENLASDIP